MSESASPQNLTLLPDVGVREELLGEHALLEVFLRELCPLRPVDLEQVVRHQSLTGQTFGDAALSLGLVTQNDVLQAQVLRSRHEQLLAAQQIPHPDFVVRSQPLSPASDAFRQVRSHYLLHARQQSKKLPLAVVSPDIRDGRSFFCANLAAALSQLEGRVLIIDANLRQPRLHTIFSVSDRVGLTDVLSGRRTSQVIQEVPGFERLFCVSAGGVPPHPAELIEGDAFARLVQEANDRFDHVVIDTPACSVGMDAIVVAARCGSALILSRSDANKISDLQDLSAALKAVQVDIVGVVINDHSFSRTS